LAGLTFLEPLRGQPLSPLSIEQLRKTTAPLAKSPRKCPVLADFVAKVGDEKDLDHRWS
jgi:hypothetical protein